MEQFRGYSENKNKIKIKLESINNVLSIFEGLGLDMSDYKEKIKQSLIDLEDEYINIALVGAFSDGKTSTIAGWLGMEIDNMKIATDESSDKIEIYEPKNLPEKCRIIDTPGLFGNKEYNLEQKTKDFISRAHIILYVVDATNPLKESQKDSIELILRKLNKFSTTIFVINKMDAVADLSDDEEFDELEEIKRDNLVDKIDRFINLTENEKNNIRIVCISANPNTRGLPYWFENKEKYESRSRINNLIEVSNDVLKETTAFSLLEKTGIDTLFEMASIISDRLDEVYSVISTQYNQLEIDKNRINEDIIDCIKIFNEAKHRIQEDLKSYEKELCNKARGIDFDNVLIFLQDEIGYLKENPEKNGYKLNNEIDRIFEMNLKEVNIKLDSIHKNIEIQLNKMEKLNEEMSNLLSKGFSVAGKTLKHVPKDTIKKGIFAARDLLGKLTGKVIKFKPWQATKIATKISKAMGPIFAAIDVILEVIKVINADKENKKLNKMREDITETILNTFYNYFELFKDESKLYETFMPQISEYRNIISIIEQDMEDFNNNMKTIENGKKTLLLINGN